jgi:hypothetical protein
MLNNNSKESKLNSCRLQVNHSSSTSSFTSIQQSFLINKSEMMNDTSSKDYINSEESLKYEKKMATNKQSSPLQTIKSTNNQGKSNNNEIEIIIEF